MLTTFLLSLGLMMLAVYPALAAPPARKPLAESGQVQLVAIHVHRDLDSSIEPRHEAFTWIRLRVDLKEKSVPAKLVSRFSELAPIRDDRGTLLSTAARIESALHDETPVELRGPSGQEASYSLELRLEAPARDARKIPLLQGKIVCAKPKLAAVGFSQIGGYKNQRLEHPKLQGLDARASVSVKDDQTIVTLRAPRWNNRLAEWGIAAKGKLLDAFYSNHNGAELVKGYVGDLTAGDHQLVLVIVEPTEPETFDFEFRDIELP